MRNLILLAGLLPFTLGAATAAPQHPTCCETKGPDGLCCPDTCCKPTDNCCKATPAKPCATDCRHHKEPKKH